MDNGDRVLLVEGQDDEHVVLNLRLKFQSMPHFHIENKGGVRKLLDSIIQEARVSGRKALGILLDVDDDLNARWSAVADRLRRLDIDVPLTPEQTGTLIDGTNRTPRIGIWLMPDNQSSGELEDFVSEMIPDGDTVWPRSERYINGIPKEDRKFSDDKIHRARIHAWLATRKEPRKIGTAIHTGDLRVDGMLSTDFSEWLRKLFG